MLILLSPATKRYAFKVGSFLKTSTTMECFPYCSCSFQHKYFYFAYMSLLLRRFFLRLLPYLASLYWASRHFQDEGVSLMPNPQPRGPGFYFRVCCPSGAGKITRSSRNSPPRHFGFSSGTCHAWVTLPIARYRRQGPSFSEAGYTQRQVCFHVCKTKNVLNELIQWVLLEKIILS